MGRKLGKKEIMGIIKDYKAGMKWSEIEDKYDTTRGTISRIIKEAGVEPDRQNDYSFLKKEKGDKNELD